MRTKRWHWFAGVIDGRLIPGMIIGCVENGLEIKWGVVVPCAERNWDYREALRQTDRPN
jgi:hypothetical protein